MNSDVHAVPHDAGLNGHKPDRACSCAPRMMRDLTDGSIVWVHRRPTILPDARHVTYLPGEPER